MDSKKDGTGWKKIGVYLVASQSRLHLNTTFRAQQNPALSESFNVALRRWGVQRCVNEKKEVREKLSLSRQNEI